MSSPRRLQFRVGSSLLTASLALAGCDDADTTKDPASAKQPDPDADRPSANPEPVAEPDPVPSVNPEPIPEEAAPQVYTNEGPELDPEPPRVNMVAPQVVPQVAPQVAPQPPPKPVHANPGPQQPVPQTPPSE